MLFAAALSAAGQSSPPGDASMLGIVCDSQHHPVAGADVFLQSTAGTPVSNTRTDSRGAFKFSALPQGSYTLHAETEGAGKTTSSAVTLGKGEVKTVDLVFSDSNLPFFDQPTFSVAGVTDTTNLGGHGSDTVVRARNALAKATVSLSKDAGPEVNANPAATESKLREAQLHDPASFAANYQLGKFLVESGRSGDAKPYLARAAEIEAKNQSLTVHEKAGLHHLLGDIAEQNGDPLEAVREYERAAELDPNEATLFDWGAELLLHHAPEPATEVFSNGNRRFPQSVRMLIGLGVAWYVRGSYEEATRRMCEAADLAPNDPTPYLFLGKIQSVESSVSAGIAERLSRFAAIQPQNAMANYYDALSLWKQRKGPDDRETAAKVQALLEKAVTLDPKLSEAFLQLGIVHAEGKDFPQAIAAYQHAIQANPRMEQAHYRLAQAYRLSGQNDKAQDELRLYERLSKEKADEVERERSDIKQFVYTLREQKSSPQP